MKLYILLVRSRLDYGSIFYDTVSDAHIGKLNVVENTCLRVAIGARKTSPISSLEVESFIPPLCLHRKETIVKYYCRINQLPLELPVCRNSWEIMLTSL